MVYVIVGILYLVATIVTWAWLLRDVYKDHNEQLELSWEQLTPKEYIDRYSYQALLTLICAFGWPLLFAWWIVVDGVVSFIAVRLITYGGKK